MGAARAPVTGSGCWPACRLRVSNAGDFGPGMVSLGRARATFAAEYGRKNLRGADRVGVEDRLPRQITALLLGRVLGAFLGGGFGVVHRPERPGMRHGN